MRVLVLDGLGRPVTLPATRVVVTDDAGTPLALAVELAPGVVDVATCDHPDFNAKLRVHGVDRTTQVEELRPPQIRDFDFEIR